MTPYPSSLGDSWGQLTDLRLQSVGISRCGGPEGTPITYTDTDSDTETKTKTDTDTGYECGYGYGLGWRT